jgi:hypothetical protein
MREVDQAAQAAGTTRERVVQNITQGCQGVASEAAQAVSERRGDYYQTETLEKQSGRQPGDVSPELGQDSGTAWQESQQMGRTGHGGVQNPQANP